MAIEKVPSASLAAFLAKHPEPTPVMFAATWCGFCARFLPLYRGRGEKAPGTFALVDISDESDPAWDDHRIEVVPTVIVFESGTAKARVGGVLGAVHLEKVLAEGKVA